MSFNQSRAERSDSSQYRKPSRSGSFSQRNNNYSGNSGKGGGSTAPPPSSSLQPNRSFKKTNNAQGGQQPRAGTYVANPNVDSGGATAPRAAQNGSHSQPATPGPPSAPVSSTVSKPAANLPVQRSAQVAPKAPTPQPANVKPDPAPPTTPAKATGDASKSFPIQFGSVSPGTLNGMQIPARTSSAPPNLDEQQRDQARRDSQRQVPAIPIPSAPKQQITRKDGGANEQPKISEPHQLSKARRDVQASSVTPVSQTQKPSVHSISGVSMPMPFHQPQVALQFGGPTPQVQSQGMVGTSLPMPMPLPMGSAPQLQQSVYVSGLHHHQMQPQGIMHQGQGMNFTNQMGPQLPTQLGNLGIGVGPQFPHPAAKFLGSRKPVKITHPDTHEELRLDNASASRLHQNASQAQPVTTVPSNHPINYYPNSVYFPAPGPVPLTSTINPSSQASRFSFPVSQGPQTAPFMNPSHSSYPSKSNPIMHGVSEPSKLDSSDVHKVVPTVASAPIQVTIKPATELLGEKMKTLAIATSSVEKSGSQQHGETNSVHTQRDSGSRPKSSSHQPKLCEPTSSSLPVQSIKPNPSTSSPSSALEVQAPVVTQSSGSKMETVTRSDSMKDQVKKQIKKGQSQPGRQVTEQFTSASRLPSQSLEHIISTSETLGTEPATSLKSSAPIVVGSVVTDSPGENADSFAQGEPILHVDIESKENGGAVLNKAAKQDENKSKTLSESATSSCSEVNNGTEIGSSAIAKVNSNEVGPQEIVEKGAEDPLDSCEKDNYQVFSSSLAPDAVSTSAVSSLVNSDGGQSVSTQEVSIGEIKSSDSTAVTKPVVSDDGIAPVSAIPPLDLALTGEEGTGEVNAGLAALPTASGKEKPVPELGRSKSSMAKVKKKRKDMLQKADAAGTTSDLYNAYKGPEEKNESATSLEGAVEEVVIVNSTQDDVQLSNKDGQDKAEPDDWEDAADLSTPKLETVDNADKIYGGLEHDDSNATGSMVKKYTRDFLLKFSEQCTDLPEGFEITSDVADAVMVPHVNASRESYPSPGRVVDRSPGGPRRGMIVGEEDRWSKSAVPLVSPRDPRMDGYGGNFRPSQGGIHGVLRNPRGQTSVQYAGGILSGPMQSMGSQGVMQRSNSDADRWQRATGFQRGLIPSPQTPTPVMHKAERKYQVGKITDEEEAKQRQLKGILNKLTPQNFEKLFEQVKAVNIDNAGTLTGVISQIFDKALMEPTFCEMYANFCSHLSGELPDFCEDNEKITFKRLLLNKCQEEFERGEREQEEADRADAEGEVALSAEEREEKRIRVRRRMLGNIRLIGELYKKKMLTERIMHECIMKLLGQYQNPDEEDIEALCKLMSTIGEMIDHPKAKEHMDAYFDMMSKLSNNMKLSSRVRFMLKDSIDLRKNKWQQRRKVEGPKKIDEVHRDAAQERMGQVGGRQGRGSVSNSSVRNRQPMEFGSRGSIPLSSPSTQMGGYRGLPTQPRGFGVQDTRIDDRHSFDSWTASVPLPQRPSPGEGPITLGPQGGLARGMSIRGQPSMPSMGLAETSSFGDSRRSATALNGFGSVQDRAIYGSREDPMPRYNMPDRFVTAPYDQGPVLDRNLSFGNRDLRNVDRTGTRNQSRPSSPNVGGLPPSQSISSDKGLSEERLREKSLAAIKEFYSVRDEKEVALCVKDLNAPNFYPTMISLWVSDSFERKDMERDCLAKLLTNLSKSRDSIFNHDHLIKGFESVLSTLEDAVNDAPKAGEFLGQIFAKVMIEDVIPFPEIGQLIYEGGEEKGSLVEIGLAAEVVGTILEIVKSEKGESFLNEIRTSSSSRLERFRPPNWKRPLRLDKFI